MAAARTVTNRTQNIGVTALSKETGISLSTVSKMMTRGKTPDDIRAYARLKHGDRTPITPPPVTPTVPATDQKEFDLIMETRSRVFELEVAKLRRAKALAEKQEIENFVRKGELCPLSHVRQFVGQILIEGRDQIERLPELAGELASIDDPVKVRQILIDVAARIVAKFEELNAWGRDVRDEGTQKVA
jgi:hypothetical protein